MAVGLYFVTALALKGPLGFLGLVLADSVKQAGHAVIMTFLLLRSVGRPQGQRIPETLLKAGAAALAMGAGVWMLASWLGPRLPEGFAGELGLVALALAAGGALYVVALRALGLPEVDELIGLARRKPSRN